MRIPQPYSLSNALFSTSWCYLTCATIMVLLLPPAVMPAVPVIYGTLPEEFVSSSDEYIVIQSNALVNVALFGTDINQVTHISFSTVQYASNGSCEHHRATISFPVTSKSSFVGNATIKLRELSRGESAFFLCMRILRSSDASTPEGISSAQGDEVRGTWLFATPDEDSQDSSDIRITGLAYRTTSSLMPLWLQLIIIIVLFCLSGLFSGLNLGLMSLDKTELKIIETAGAPKERLYAKAIRPIREKGNLLLCTLLLGNVLVNTSLTILMDDITGSGLFAVIASTIGITVFGEIVPQAVCSRHGLAIGARTIWLTKAFMVILFVVAYPIGFLLDKLLGEELGQVYNREKLCVLVNEQEVAGTVAPDERNIITGALALRTKTVANVMTPLADAFMLAYNDLLDFNTMERIYSSGYTRIPVYEGDRENIRSILNIKDLAFVNTEHRVPVSTICGFYNRAIILVDETTHLDAMLKEFRQGRAHMAFVESLVTRGDGDPKPETIGLVTLEDVIEEIIQAEIMDETDNPYTGQRRNMRRRDFRMFRMHDGRRPPRLNPQLKIAVLRHLSSNFPAFSENLVNISLLQTFLNSDIVCDHTFDPDDDAANIIYERNVPAKFAILLLQGRVNVALGEEGLVFEAEPFYMFGEALLNRTNDVVAKIPESSGETRASISLADDISYTPDYTLTARTNLQYLRITPSHYMLLRLMHEQRADTLNTTPRESNAGEHLHPGASLPTIFPSVDSQNLFQHAWEERTREHSDGTGKAGSLPHPLATPPEVSQIEANATEVDSHDLMPRRSRPNNLALQSGDIRASRPEELNVLLSSSQEKSPASSKQSPPPDEIC